MESEEDRYKIGRIIEFGAAWESKLRALRCDGVAHTSREIACRLGVNMRTLQAQEERLGLRSGRDGDGSGVFVSPIPHHLERARLEQLEKGRRYREQWLKAVQEDPQTNLLTLKDKLPAAYNWFHKNDGRWMREHTPRRHNERKPVGIDWQARDDELSAAVRRSAERLMKEPGRPGRVSVAAIARDTGKLPKVLSKDARLPLTNRALMEVAESVEAWAIRRIRWAVECYRCEGVCATHWEILARAGLSGKMRASPSILAIVEEGVRSLRHFSRKID